MKFSVIAAAAVLLTGCDAEQRAAAFDRPALAALVPDQERAAIAAADRHILVVRHALKTAPDCNALDCPLSERGEAMVERLAGLIGEPPVDAAYASAACRTQHTARAGGRPVVAHQARDGLPVGCEEEEIVERMRSEAFIEAMDGTGRWTLVAEHSNTVCAWIVAFSGGEGAEASGCQEGRVSDGAYGDIYWLYRDGEIWRLVHLPGAFAVAAELATPWPPE